MHRLNDGILKMKTIHNLNNNKIFDRFAKYYDLLYSDKNYKNEVIVLIKKIRKEQHNAKSILDLGCGTGNHAIHLSDKSFNVTGIDKSSVNIQIAKQKSKKVNFIVGDITNYKSNIQYDICLSMFSTICYLSNIEFKQMLKNIFKLLKPGGIFIFDYWNGNAVLTEKPSQKIKIIKKNNIRLFRIATPNVDTLEQKCSIEYHCIVEENLKFKEEFKEIHTMRYYFPAEMNSLLQDAGFIDIKIDSMNKEQNDVLWPLKNWYFLISVKKPE